VPRLQLIDFDVVEETNVTTQGYDFQDIGQSKVDATAGAVQRIDPQLSVEVVPDRYRSRIAVGEALFCCVDSIASRSAIWRSAGSRWSAALVIGTCPDAQWRLLFALSRYGGLRCPSEHLGLRWADVDWEHERMTVHVPKLEHHVGKETRVIPIFPELRPYLEEAWELAEPGTEYVITRYRGRNANFRTQLLRIIKRAGLKPWPKLFQNLRSTREAELSETFPLHVVCAWIGNSQPVAAKHYLQTTEEHFPKAVQNPVQQMHERPGNVSQAKNGGNAELHDLPGFTVSCCSETSCKIPPRGFEPLSQD